MTNDLPTLRTNVAVSIYEVAFKSAANRFKKDCAFFEQKNRRLDARRRRAAQIEAAFNAVEEIQQKLFEVRTFSVKLGALRTAVGDWIIDNCYKATKASEFLEWN